MHFNINDYMHAWSSDLHQWQDIYIADAYVKKVNH